ncbi:streptomycin 3''-adenylyltransferase [bacterium BMS3Abin02]|nr:streptomycin 3''-adenylyltransferase [bacterium BMS3Abin02]GBE22792.1 streptomycin 3''-adenylyltransferase [bacterium BMS3Bbin01]HDH27132.1 DUF4111 domain-containing protein [Actinomycetota bacterium]
MWPKEVDVDITSWVESLVAGIADVLGDELVGVYLHGSLAMGGYYRPKSDLDLLIVCSTPLGPATREQTARALLTASDRRPTIGDVEASVLQIAHTRRFSHPSPFEMHFSETHSEAIRTGRFDYTIQHTDPDLAAHCTVVRSRGCRLLGEDIGNVFGQIPHEAYLDSIRGDLLWILQDEHLLATPFYGVLNACRVFMVLERGPELVPSKEEAALWALEWAPIVHQTLIRQCLACYRSSVNVTERPTHGHAWDRSRLLGFRDWARTIS